MTGPFPVWHDFRKPALNVFTVAGAIKFLGIHTRRLHPFPNCTTTADVNCPKVLTYIDLIMCELMMYAWPFVTTILKGSLIAVATIYEFCSGAYFTSASYCPAAAVKCLTAS